MDSEQLYDRQFQLLRTFNRPIQSFGFLDIATIRSKTIGVMGEVEELTFDVSKCCKPDALCEQVREFVLGYLLKVSDFRIPEVMPEPRQGDADESLILGLARNNSARGFGYSQFIYRSRHGDYGRFPEHSRFAITDAREIAQDYKWIVLGVDIFDFDVTISPFGSPFPELRFPLEESSLLVISPDFVVDESTERELPNGDRVIGQYGFGYAFMRSSLKPFLGYGPGEFDVAFQQFRFDVLSSGEIRLRLVFVANRPTQIGDIPVDLIDMGLRFVSKISAGYAASIMSPMRAATGVFRSRRVSQSDGRFRARFDSRETSPPIPVSEQLERYFLLQHFRQHYSMVRGALSTWRSIPDWTDETALPEWVRTGVSS